jgi:hypothetical protein
MAEGGLTRNEALIALASRGAAALREEQRAGDARRRIARALREPSTPDAATGSYLSADEVEAAVREARGGRP